LRGREYNGKYYNTLNAYKIESSIFWWKILLFGF
jgi:hypothetical protein